MLLCWSLVLQLCAFFPHLLQRRGSSIALRNISTTSLQHFFATFCCFLFSSSPHVPETIAIFFIAYLFVTFLRSCLCICWGLQCSFSLEHRITHSVFVFPKFFSCTRILLSMHVLSLLLFCVSSEDQDDLHYSSRFIFNSLKESGL